jgi:ankyrin repeat protein
MISNFVKKVIIAALALIPLLVLGIYTLNSTRQEKKTKTVTDTTLNYRPPAEISDEIASYIEEGDHETALIKINDNLTDPDIPTSRGLPLLVLAADKNDYDIVGILLAKGSSPNFADINSGETALIKAARNGNLDMMNLLILANADVNAQSKRGVSVLTSAIQNGNPQLTEFLMSRGARAGASQENMMNYAFQKKFVGVDAMLKTGVRPNFTDKNGNTPLIVSASYGDLQSVQQLLIYKADINAANNAGMTPLLYAIQTKNKEITEYLLSKKEIDINKANNNGETPLFWAAYTGNKQLVDDLLKMGADYDKANKAGVTPLQASQRNKQAETAKLLKDFIDYKNIPRDEKGRPIIKKNAPRQKQKAGAAPASGKQIKQPAAKTTQQPDGTVPVQQGMPVIPNVPGMPSVPGFDPSSLPAGTLPPEMGAMMQQAQGAQQQAGQQAQGFMPPSNSPRPVTGGTQPNKLRTSSL